MSSITEKITGEWPDTANIALGIWLVISPWILQYTAQQTATVNAVVVGIVIVLAAAAAIYAFQEWEEWLNVVLAAWLVVSPWLPQYATLSSATWNQLVVGILVGAISLWSANSEHRRLSKK